MDESRFLNRIQNSTAIGAFFLLAFLFYGVGQSLFETGTQLNKYTGAALIALNSIIVFFIGFLLKKTLKHHSKLVGNLYFVTRLLEAVLLATLIFNLIPTINLKKEITYFLPMLILGIGSVPMCFVLHKNKLVPSWLAIWGIIGYIIFSLGFLMELFGKAWSMYFLVIGGIWEVVFAIWLLVKGKNKT